MMDRTSALEQQYQDSGGGIGGKNRRESVRLIKRSATMSESKPTNSRFVGSEDNKQQDGAIRALANEISTVVQEQEEVLGSLKRKSGLFPGLGGRFKSVIRGTDVEHDDPVREKHRQSTS